MSSELPLFEHWNRLLDWLLDRLERFPKDARFTLAQRMANLALDALEAVIEATYTKNRLPILQRLNLILEKLPVLVRLAHHRRYLSDAQYEFAARELLKAGRMAGGWLKHAAS
ncbi:MAG: diversity-generating retroelement protein Avd [Candidatus Delongbacteria bacterium]|nr:diversity-generating retroelement protein Avd [Candidatus Delongbacteria bacterium]